MVKVVQAQDWTTDNFHAATLWTRSKYYAYWITALDTSLVSHLEMCSAETYSWACRIAPKLARSNGMVATRDELRAAVIWNELRAAVLQDLDGSFYISYFDRMESQTE